MQASSAAFDLIKKYEGLCLTSYRCPADIPTIGWGHTMGVQMGTTITQDEAQALLEKDVAACEVFLDKALKVAVTQNQFDALVSFVFNIGATKFAKSTLLYKLNADDVAGAAAEFPRWVHAAGGKVLEGLKKRRAEEVQLFSLQTQ